jgi:hypothetical protein
MGALVVSCGGGDILVLPIGSLHGLDADVRNGQRVASNVVSTPGFSGCAERPMQHLQRRVQPAGSEYCAAAFA